MNRIDADDPPQSRGALPSHLNNLDFLRIALAIVVVVSHSFAIRNGSSDLEPVYRLTRHGWDLGKQAVVGFFAISGMLVTQSWLRTDDLGRFLAKRSLRIFPGYAVAVVVCILVFTPAVGSLALTWRPLAVCGLELEPLHAQHLLTGNPFPQYINGSIWTIRYEFYCYLILACLGLAGVLRRPWATACAFAASLSLVVAERFANRRGVNPSVAGIGDLAAWARFLPPFLAGAVAFHFRHRVTARGWVVCAGLALVLALFRYEKATVARLVAPAVTAYGVVYVGFHPALRLHRVGRWGDFSYGTYLYAWPIQQTLVRFTGSTLNPWTLSAAAVPLAVLAGVASWHLVERPATGIDWPARFRRRPTAGLLTIG
jgi:peptidoglycan/LPS O-acetylase OafA/YrhL